MTNELAAINPQPLDCFVIMPISDPDGYAPGHFRHVFDDIFVPACKSAGFRAVLASQVVETNLIHLDILQRLLESPLVLCDLSSRNPNVLFELGLRQAFDKPVVLVQEVGTPKIFDIAVLRCHEYHGALLYHEVLEDQKLIAEAIKGTAEAIKSGTGVNSIVRFLSLSRPATPIEIQEANRDPNLQIIRAEVSELRQEIRSFRPTIPSTTQGILNSILSPLKENYRYILSVPILQPTDTNRALLEKLKESLKKAISGSVTPLGATSEGHFFTLDLIRPVSLELLNIIVRNAIIEANYPLAAGGWSLVPVPIG